MGDGEDEDFPAVNIMNLLTHMLAVASCDDG
jgi:hypothetical protein